MADPVLLTVLAVLVVLFLLQFWKEVVGLLLVAVLSLILVGGVTIARALQDHL
jgi:hypothetical protein